MRQIKHIFFLSLFLSSLLLPQYRTETMSVPEGGIPLNLVYSMIQDSRGFIWFGTMYGLVRYDGIEYKTFRHDPEDPQSISYDDIISLYEDSKGFIWIGTWGGGLNKYDPDNNSFQRFSSEEGLNDIIIWDINEDNEGSIWLAGQSGGIVKFLPSTNTFIKYPSGKVNKIVTSGSGEVLLCTNNGIQRLYNNIIMPDERFGIVKDFMISDIIIKDNNQFWIATNQGIFVVENNSIIKSFNKELSAVSVRKLVQSPDGNIWAGTVHGLNLISEDTVKSFLPYNTGSNFVHDFFFDDSGILWVSTYNVGVWKVKYGSPLFYSLPVENIISITSDNNSNVYLANTKGELLSFNKGNNSAIVIYKTGQRINQISYKDNCIWITSPAGLLKYDIKTKKLITSTPGMFTTKLHDDDHILLGIPGIGLHVFDGFTIRKINSDSTGNHFTNNILSMYKDSKNRIWLGTYGGLILLDKNYLTAKRFRYDENNKYTLSNNYVFSIYEDAEKTLWVGTSNGLNKFVESGETFRRYYEKDGLPNGVINGISSDKENNLWIITNKGLSVFNHIKNEFRNYNALDGLSGNVFRNNGILKDNTGTMFLCGQTGVDYFNPEHIKLSQYKPKVVITSLSSGEEELFAQNNHLRLNHDQNSLRIKFASLHFDNPQKHQYRYLLENFDNKWIESKNNNTAVYTNLPPGNYIFRVYATNSDGVWSSNSASLTITIIPPFYQTWWFILLCVIIILAAAIVLTRLKIKREMKFAAAVEKARIEESEKIRMKTAMDFHDELGHHLTRISLLAGLIKKKPDINPSDRSLLDNIIENANNLYAGTKDFIWSIDPHNDTLYEVLIRLKDFGDELYDKSNICFETSDFDESLKNISLSMDFRRNIILIFKEAMNNSLKYSSSDRIVLQSAVKDNEILISLQDFGRGISSYKNDINGLANMKRRAEKLFGMLEITSEPDHGTRITFKSIINRKEIKFN